MELSELLVEKEEVKQSQLADSNRMAKVDGDTLEGT